MKESDVIVVGGGPAGSTCAWRLKRAGMEVLVLDKAGFPRPKPCAGWVTPGVLRHLEIDPSAYPHSLTRFDRIHFHFFGRRLTLPTRQYALCRDEFDAWLLTRAGAPVIRHEVRDIRQASGHFVIDEAYRCRLLIGAGGTKCPVYRTLFAADSPRHGASLVATLEAEFAREARDRECRLWFFTGGLPGYAWYVPKEGGRLNIGLGARWSSLKGRGEGLREHRRAFAAMLSDLGLVDAADVPMRGHAYYLRMRGMPVRREGAFLLGDAAGLATLDMGEGIGPAVESAIAAARAITEGMPYSLRGISRFSFPRLLFPGAAGRTRYPQSLSDDSAGGVMP